MIPEDIIEKNTNKSNLENGYFKVGDFKLAWGNVLFTTSSNVDAGYYNTKVDIITPISFQHGHIFLQPASGNGARKIFVRPDNYELSGTGMGVLVMSDIANYSNRFNWLVIGR